MKKLLLVTLGLVFLSALAGFGLFRDRAFPPPDGLTVSRGLTVQFRFEPKDEVASAAERKKIAGLFGHLIQTQVMPPGTVDFSARGWFFVAGDREFCLYVKGPDVPGMSVALDDGDQRCHVAFGGRSRPAKYRCSRYVQEKRADCQADEQHSVHKHVFEFLD